MGRGSTANKMQRLDQLLGRLKSGDTFTTAQLSSELSVSLRTLVRDLQTLKDQGYPIESEKGRGGGVRLYARWGVGRLALNYREVLDLLLAITILEQLNSPLFLTHLPSVKNKLFASFPDAQRPHIQQLRQRIRVGSIASDQVLGSYETTLQGVISDSVMQAFFESHRLDITYQRADGEVTRREIEIHHLYLNWPVWYLLCWDKLRNSTRIFRLDRIQSAHVTDKQFKLLSISEFDADWEQTAKRL